MEWDGPAFSLLHLQRAVSPSTKARLQPRKYFLLAGPGTWQRHEDVKICNKSDYIMVIEGWKLQWSTNEPETLFRLHLALVSICHACRQTFPATCRNDSMIDSTWLISTVKSRLNRFLCWIGILLRQFVIFDMKNSALSCTVLLACAVGGLAAAWKKCAVKKTNWLWVFQD